MHKEAAIEIFAYPGTRLPKQYINLVKSRWIRNYRTQNDFMKMVHAPCYYSAYNVYISNILNRDSSIVRLAVLSEDNDVVLGFSIMAGSNLHYVHVPKGYRRQGIGRLLVPEYIESFSHITRIGIQIWHKKFPRAKFNPFTT